MVVILSDVQNFTCREISDILDIPLSAARSRLWRGRRRLQRILWKQAQLSQEDQRALEAASGAEEAYLQGRGPGGACSGPSVWPRLAAMGMSASDSKGTNVI
jgi:RNA polymerase sigma-70 factor (ECF subfamily)